MFFSSQQIICFLVATAGSSVSSREESDQAYRAMQHQDSIQDIISDSWPTTQQHPPEDFFVALPTTETSDNKLQTQEDVQDDTVPSIPASIPPMDMIFRLKKGGSLSDTQREGIESLINEYGTSSSKLTYEYKHVFPGFAMQSVVPTLRGKIDDLLYGSIEQVEIDSPVLLDSVEPATDPEVHHHPPSWGLDRLDRFDVVTQNHTNAFPFDGKYHYLFTGKGTRVYILDTGVRASHLDLAAGPTQSRVTCGFDAFSDTDENTSCIDKVGHGTFMAGVIGGDVYGVAKKTDIVSVKVFNDVGDGTVASVIAGLEYVLAQKKANPKVPSIANLSFGTRDGLYELFEDAVDAVTQAGVTVVTSSGNGGSFHCKHYPAAFPSVITAAASTYKDESAYYNDLGRCVDLFAPGDRVSGIWSRDDEDTVTISGSSIASAHVAGSAALMLEAFPMFTPEHVRLALLDTAESGSITGILPETKARNLLVNTAILTSVPDYDGITPV